MSTRNAQISSNCKVSDGFLLCLFMPTACPFSLAGEFLLRLRHLEKSLLQALNDVKGRILDDDRQDTLPFGLA